MLSRVPLFLRVALVLIAVLSVFLWYTVPRWRFEAKLEEADAQIAARDFTGAAATLTEALETRPGQREGIVRLIGLLRLKEPEEAFGLAYTAHESGILVGEDYPEAIALGYELGQEERATEMLEAAQAAYPAVTELDGVAGIRELLAGRPREALTVIEEALALEPESSLLLFWKGQIMRGSESRIDHIQAKQALQAAARTKDYNGLRASLALADSANLAMSTEERREMLREAEAHPLATAEWRLLALRGLVLVEGEKREEYVAQAVEAFGESDPELLGRWLGSVGEYARALEYLPADAESLGEADHFDARFRALTLAGRLDEAESLLESGSGEGDALQQASRRFVVAAGQEDREAAVRHWESAMELAAESVNEPALVALARGALQVGHPEGALRAYEALFTEDFAERAPAGVWLDRFSVELLGGEETRALATIRSAAVHHPEHLVILNNQLYLELLLDEGWETSLAAFEEHLAPLSDFRDPEPFAATLAFARIQQGKAEEAKAILDQLHQIKGDSLSDSTRVVEALVLAGEGRAEDASAVAGSVDRQRVLPREWSLIAGMVSGGERR